MDDGAKRGELEKARSPEDLRSSTAWKEVGDLSKPFHEGLVALFLEENKDLSHLTKTYGLF